MAIFDDEQVKTSGKMSDLIMEYVSQFIARDFYEVYEHAAETVKHEPAQLTPAEFDDRIYRKTTKLISKNSRRGVKALRFAIGLIVAAICIFCVAFTITVLLRGALFGDVIFQITF